MSLRSFLEEMEKMGEIVHVRDEVSPRFEYQQAKGLRKS